MNGYGKKSTPQTKQPPRRPLSASKATPTNFNATLQSQTLLNVTGAIPRIKPNLTPQVDYDLECDFAFGAYLEALMKKQLLEDMTSVHKQDLNDQLINQKEKLYREKMKLRDVERELEDAELIEELTPLVDVMEKNLAALSLEKSDLDCTIKQLLEVLNSACNRVNVKSVRLLKNQEDFEKLLAVLKKVEEAVGKVERCNPHMDKMCRLGQVAQQYQQNLEKLTQKQKEIEKLQKDATHKVLKAVSEMYSKREGYTDS